MTAYARLILLAGLQAFATLGQLGCNAGPQNRCRLDAAPSYVEDGRQRLLELIQSRAETGNSLGDGSSRLSADELRQITPSSLRFVEVMSSELGNRGGFVLWYEYHGREDWTFAVTYDQDCSAQVAWGRVRE